MLLSLLRKLDGFPWRHLEGEAHIPLSTVTELKPSVLNSVWVKVWVEEVFLLQRGLDSFTGITRGPGHPGGEEEIMVLPVEVPAPSECCFSD